MRNLTGNFQMQTSCEIVKAAIEFKGPSRLPVEDLFHPERSDIVGVGFEPIFWQWRQTAPGVEECTDLFGCVRRRHGEGIGEVVGAPMQSWDDLDNYQLPDIDHLKAKILGQIQALPQGKFVLGDVGQFLAKVFEIRGFENTLLDLGLYPEKIRVLAERLTDFALKRCSMYAETGKVHGISMYDDWGTQKAMLLSPDLWRKLFLDLYRRVFDYAHANDMYVYFHCCGAVDPLVPDIIDAGADIINFNQPRLHGIAHLGDKYAGKVTFSCPVDIQVTLPTLDKKLIKDEAIELVKHLHRNGGFIANIYYDGLTTDDAFDPAEYSREVFESIEIS